MTCKRAEVQKYIGHSLHCSHVPQTSVSVSTSFKSIRLASLLRLSMRAAVSVVLWLSPTFIGSKLQSIHLDLQISEKKKHGENAQNELASLMLEVMVCYNKKGACIQNHDLTLNFPPNPNLKKKHVWTLKSHVPSCGLCWKPIGGIVGGFPSSEVKELSLESSPLLQRLNMYNIV